MSTTRFGLKVVPCVVVVAVSHGPSWAISIDISGAKKGFGFLVVSPKIAIPFYFFWSIIYIYSNGSIPVGVPHSFFL